LLDAGGELLLEFCKVEIVKAIAFFEQAESLSDDFASGEVASTFHFVVDELFELGGEGDVHRVMAAEWVDFILMSKFVIGEGDSLRDGKGDRSEGYF
jgi:hypothetical protein